MIFHNFVRIIPLRSAFAGFLAAGAVVLSIPALAQEKTAESFRQIIVTGTGEVSGKPDLALASLTILRIAPTAATALDETSRAMTDLVTAMKALGIEPRDLQTNGFQVTPQYHYDNTNDGTQKPPKLVGYEIRNTLSVRIRDLPSVGKILDQAVALGVNEGSGLQFTIDDPSQMRMDAQIKAVENARASATALAQAAGVALGPVVSLDVSAEPMPPMPMELGMARIAVAPKADSRLPVEIGENTINAKVRMVFSIANDS